MHGGELACNLMYIDNFNLTVYLYRMTLTYGIDWEGPDESEDYRGVTVPEAECSLPLSRSNDYGIDIYECTLAFLTRAHRRRVIVIGLCVCVSVCLCVTT